MGTSLFMAPASPTAASFLSDQLKFVLRRTSPNDSVDMIFTRQNLDYLKGLADAGITDALKIIELLEKYDEVRVWEEC